MADMVAIYDAAFRSRFEFVDSGFTGVVGRNEAMKVVSMTFNIICTWAWSNGSILYFQVSN
jgi:hypothetical protein